MPATKKTLTRERDRQRYLAKKKSIAEKKESAKSQVEHNEAKRVRYAANPEPKKAISRAIGMLPTLSIASLHSKPGIGQKKQLTMQHLKPDIRRARQQARLHSHLVTGRMQKLANLHPYPVTRKIRQLANLHPYPVTGKIQQLAKLHSHPVTG